MTKVWALEALASFMAGVRLAAILLVLLFFALALWLVWQDIRYMKKKGVD